MPSSAYQKTKTKPVVKISRHKSMHLGLINMYGRYLNYVRVIRNEISMFKI